MDHNITCPTIRTKNLALLDLTKSHYTFSVRPPILKTWIPSLSSIVFISYLHIHLFKSLLGICFIFLHLLSSFRAAISSFPPWSRLINLYQGTTTHIQREAQREDDILLILLLDFLPQTMVLRNKYGHPTSFILSNFFLWVDVRTQKKSYEGYD